MSSLSACYHCGIRSEFHNSGRYNCYAVLKLFLQRMSRSDRILRSGGIARGGMWIFQIALFEFGPNNEIERNVNQKGPMQLIHLRKKVIKSFESIIIDNFRVRSRGH
jgi:hypothetical protein